VPIATRVLVLWLAVAAGCASSNQEDDEALVVANRQEWAVTDIDGTRHDLSAELANGKSVALVFWQTWCKACLREAPELAAAARKHAGSVAFYGVVSGPDEYVDDGKVRTVAKKYSMPYPQIRDRELELTHQFHVRGTPTIVVVRPDGRVAYTGHQPPESWIDPR